MIGQMISAFGADDVAGNRPKFRKLRFQMIADSRCDGAGSEEIGVEPSDGRRCQRV
jgi:hypothetical protein